MKWWSGMNWCIRLWLMAKVTHPNGLRNCQAGILVFSRVSRQEADVSRHLILTLQEFHIVLIDRLWQEIFQSVWMFRGVHASCEKHSIPKKHAHGSVDKHFNTILEIIKKRNYKILSKFWKFLKIKSIKSINQSIKQTNHQSINQSINQSNKQTNHQSINQSNKRIISQSINQSINQSIEFTINF